MKFFVRMILIPLFNVLMTCQGQTSSETTTKSLICTTPHSFSANLTKIPTTDAGPVIPFTSTLRPAGAFTTSKSKWFITVDFAYCTVILLVPFIGVCVCDCLSFLIRTCMINLFYWYCSVYFNPNVDEKA